MADDAQYAELPYGDSAQEDDQASGSGKRKRRKNDNDATSRKRNRYINIACNECKRRKIKCNGEAPCQRCGNLKLDCVYEANCCSGSVKHINDLKLLNDHVANLEGQIQYLLHNLTNLRTSLGRDDFPELDLYTQARHGQQEMSSTMAAPSANMAIDPALQRNASRATPQQSRFQGPTSPAFGLGMAADSLKQLGLPSEQDGTLDQVTATRAGLQDHSPVTQRTLHSNKDPIWSVNKEEALRLCRVFEDENGLLYPFLDMEQIMRHATLLFSFLDAASRTMFIGFMPGSDSMQDEDTDVLKLVMAIALVTEGGGQSDRGRRLFEHVNKDAEKRLLGSVNMKDVEILTLTAIWHFHSGDEGLAWRLIGLTARHCLELGLHRAQTYQKFEPEKERSAALKLFWSIFVLDHRWSIGTGMSFALQDADLDKNLPPPEQSPPYLSTMVTYSKIAAKVWKCVAPGDAVPGFNSDFSEDEVKYLDFQVVQWYRTIPEELRYTNATTPGSDARDADRRNQDAGRGVYRLRCLLYLRQNQMRIIIHRPILHSTQVIATNLGYSRTVVDVAKDSIRILMHLNQSSDIYRTQQMTWNHFLLSALAALTLAVCHAPQEFLESCKDEFFMALDLVRGLSADSYVSKRLWRTIRSLREVVPRFSSSSRSGVSHMDGTSSSNMMQQYQPNRQEQENAQRSAAMVMAGLATGQPVDDSAFFADNAEASTALNSNITRNNQAGQLVTSPNGMADELTCLFEAAGALNHGGQSWSNSFSSADMNSSGGGTMQGQYGQWSPENEEAGRVFRGLY